MHEVLSSTRFYVVKAEELLALNYLGRQFPRPAGVEWINRATDRPLSPSTIEQLLRTYHRHDPSPSVVELRRTSGMRVIFESDADRDAFARQFAQAKVRERQDREHIVTAVFDNPEIAQKATEQMLAAGVPQDGISLLWRANAFIEDNEKAPEGHSRRAVAVRVAGGGVIGAAMGMAVLMLPGIGSVAVAGAVLASTFSSVATASGIIGATGAALATMRSDYDVEDYARNHLEDQLRRGRIFMAVDLREYRVGRENVERLLEQYRGRIV